MKKTIVLLHGITHSFMNMNALSWQLEQMDYRVEFYPYRARKHSVRELEYPL